MLGWLFDFCFALAMLALSVAGIVMTALVIGSLYEVEVGRVPDCLWDVGALGIATTMVGICLAFVWSSLREILELFWEVVEYILTRD